MITKLNDNKLHEISGMIDKANRIAKKHGLAQSITMRKMGCTVIPIKLHEKDITVYIRMWNVEIRGVQPVVDGWKFVGKIDHDESGNIVRSARGSEIPAAYRNNDGNCDVCHKNIERKNTYIIEKDGEYKQVGSACLKDFFQADILAIAKYFDSLMGLEEFINSGDDTDEDEYFGMCSGGSGEVSLVDFIAHIKILIEKHGWLSRSKAEMAGGMSTVERFWSASLPKLTDEQKADAAAFIAKVRGMHFNDSEYEYNLKNIVSFDSVSNKNMGYAASVIPWAQRKIEQEKMLALKASTQSFVGNVGEKITVTVTVDSRRELAGAYGVTFLWKMHDTSNNIFVWFASNGVCLNEGGTFKVQGTIKAHNEFNGERQTVITRCKVIG